MYIYYDYDEVVARLKAGEKLEKEELKALVYDGIEVDEVEGDSGRWTQYMQTILDIDGELWAVDWKRWLTECQENEFYYQPYRVVKQEKQIVVTEYVALEG